VNKGNGSSLIGAECGPFSRLPQALLQPGALRAFEFRDKVTLSQYVYVMKLPAGSSFI
jgi:hypothetical protein